MKAVLDGPEVPSDLVLTRCMYKWHMHGIDGGTEMALTYYLVVSTIKYFATGIMIPYTLKGVRGVLLAVSTSESTRVSKENHGIHQSGRMIKAPEWLFYQVWWFAGLAVLNFRGITESMYNGTNLNMLLGDFLDGIFSQKGIQDWKEKYCHMWAGYVRQGLRILLRDVLGVYNWVEITSGFSCRAYNALDVYIRLISTGMELPEEEAWYLLNTSVHPERRMLAVPEDWWRYSDYVSYGQRDVVAEELLQFVGMLEKVPPAATAPSMQRDHRVQVLMRHLFAGVHMTSGYAREVLDAEPQPGMPPPGMPGRPGSSGDPSPGMPPPGRPGSSGDPPPVCLRRV